MTSPVSPSMVSTTSVDTPASTIIPRKRTLSTTTSGQVSLTSSSLLPILSSSASQTSLERTSVTETAPSIASSHSRPASIATTNSFFSLRTPARLTSPQAFGFLSSPLPPGISWTHVAVLVLACLVIFGNYYCYDLPAALNVTLQDHLGSTYDTFQYQLNLLYTVYSLPNVLLPLVSGYFVDKLGVRRVMLVLVTLVVVSSVGFSLSFELSSFLGMLLSRFVLGVGGESLEVASATVLTQWFQNTSWMSLAFALQLSSSRLATVVQDNLTPVFITHNWSAGALWCGVLVTVLSFVTGIALIKLDQRGAHNLAKRQNENALDQLPFLTESEEAPLDNEVTVIDDAPSSAHAKPNDQDKGKWKFKNPFSLFALPFWFLCLGAIVFYGSVIPFIHIASTFFQTRFNTPVSMAGWYMAIPDTFSAIGTPLFGWLIDRLKLPYPAYLVFASVWACAGHFFIHFTWLPPWVGMGCLGVHFAIFPAALWPSVALMVSPSHLGLAFGWLMVSLNIGLAVLPLLVAPLIVIDKSGILFMCLSVLALMVGLTLVYFHKRGRFKVQATSANGVEEGRHHPHEA